MEKAANPRVYFTDTTSTVISAPEHSTAPPDLNSNVGAPPQPVAAPPVTNAKPAKSLKVNAANKNKRLNLLTPIKRKFQALKEWASDRKIQLRVYNDDFMKDIPQLYVTRVIMEDEINLDTDEDRGYIMPDVKKITELGGTPKLKPSEDVKIDWDEFLPPCRTPLKKSVNTT